MLPEVLGPFRRRRDWRSPAAQTAGRRILLQPRRAARVHLGCGEIHLSGYLNIDFPPEQGTARGRSRPDVEADIRDLDCPPETLREIRLSHVFEHFERAEALALLVRWHDWLLPGGVLQIEAPDFAASTVAFEARSFPEQTLILRHVFGSQEAPWASHRDGWSESRFRHVLAELGFAEVTARCGASDQEGLLRNVIVDARKEPRPRADRSAAARRLLELSMNGRDETELAILARWNERFDQLAAPLAHHR